MWWLGVAREKCKVWTEPWPGHVILAWHVQGLGSTSSNTEERGREEKEVKKERREGGRERGRAGRQADFGGPGIEFPEMCWGFTT